jgi:hypothetical protein
VVAVWHRSVGAGLIVHAAVRPAGGAWQPAETLSPGGFPRIAVDAAGNAVAIWGGSDGTNSIVQSSIRPAGGSWQPVQDLSLAGQGAFGPQVAMNAAGTAVAVWTRSNGTNLIVQARVRLAGGAWQPAEDLSALGQSATTPQVALSAAGDVVAVWNRSNGTNGIIQAAVRPAGGSWQLPALDLSASGQSAMDPQVALDAAGNAVAVWQRPNGANSIVQAAARPVSGSWQLPALDLSAPGQSASNPHVGLDGAGNAVAVWRRSNGMHAIVQARVRPPGGTWQPVDDLSPLGYTALEPQVAVNEAGNAVAVWNRFVGSVVQARVRPAGGAWEPVKDVTNGQPGQAAHVAADRAGNAAIAWYSPVGTDLIVRAASYDATSPELRNLRAPARGFARQRLSFSVDPFDTWSLTGQPVWNFGDGKTASGPTVTHTFVRRGTYTVTVTQADAVANETTVTRQLILRTARCFGAAATRVGSSGPDRIVGTRRADVIVTLGGADRVRGRGGKDRICGGKGRDRLAGGAGNDLLNGGPGKDICSQGGGRGRLVAC